MDMHKQIIDRYSGIQDVFKALGAEGCHFLVLCSIAEEYRQKPVDIIDTIRVAQSKGWIKSDFYVTNDGTPLLEYLCPGTKWIRTTVNKITQIKDNEYSEAVYYNERTKGCHFRRRYVDTLLNSRTVAEGKIKEYRIYKITEVI